MDTTHKGPLSKSEYVAQQLLNKIINGGLAPGEAVGTESELLNLFPVSRPTLREALRILESQGVLRLQPGPGGGILVKKPSIDILAHSLSVYLRLHDVPFIAVLKAREVIEPALASEAASNGTAADFAELEASIERMGAGQDQEEFVEENRIFHSIIARASGNEVLEIFWSTISVLAHGESHGVQYSFGNQQHVINAHKSILKALRARDGSTAAAKMEEHVSELEHLVRKKYQHLLTQPTSVVARQGRG